MWVTEPNGHLLVYLCQLSYLAPPMSVDAMVCRLPAPLVKFEVFMNISKYLYRTRIKVIQCFFCSLHGFLPRIGLKTGTSGTARNAFSGAFQPYYDAPLSGASRSDCGAPIGAFQPYYDAPFFGASRPECGAAYAVSQSYYDVPTWV